MVQNSIICGHLPGYADTPLTYFSLQLKVSFYNAVLSMQWAGSQHCEA